MKEPVNEHSVPRHAIAQGNLPEAQRLFGEALRIAQRLGKPMDCGSLLPLWIGGSLLPGLDVACSRTP